MLKHTPTPWKHSADDGWDVATGRDGVLLHLVYDNPANMAFAVHAANCHDDLVEACKVGLRFTKNTATADALPITKGDCDDAKIAIELLQAVIAKVKIQ